MTFLFDIGNVLLNLHFEKFYQKILGAPDAKVPADLQALMDKVEIGLIDDRDFVTQSAALFGEHITPKVFTEAWQDIFSLNLPMWEVVRKLESEGHRLILFSNTNGVHTDDFLVRYPEFSLFKEHHFSQNIGAAKPHPEFYQKAIDTYQLTASETIYLDDLAANIATGEEFGFRSWQYDARHHQEFLAWLDTIL